MGDFSVACGISGISMIEEDIVFLPLLKIQQFNDCLNNVTPVSNDGTKFYYIPFVLPIFGFVDSYGRLTVSDKSPNVNCIERFFKININEFYDNIRSNAINNKSLKIKYLADNGIYGMFIHPEIYDVMAKNNHNEYGGSDWSIYDNGNLTDDVLKMIGFEFIKEDKENCPNNQYVTKGRYFRLWRHPNYPMLDVWSDRRWIHPICNGKIVHSCYSVKNFFCEIEKETEIPFNAELIARLKKTAYYEVEFDSACAELSELQKDIEKLEKALPDRKGKMFSTYCNTIRQFNLGTELASTIESFVNIYSENISSIKEEYARFMNFKDNMYGTNRIYMPSPCFCQYGNHYAHSVVARETVKILSKKKKGKG